MDQTESEQQETEISTSTNPSIQTQIPQNNIYNNNLQNNNNDNNSQSPQNLTTIKKFIGISNIEMNLTSSFYSNYIFYPDKFKQLLTKNCSHGLIGLKNLGNTSYMNSIIQCLSNTLELTYYYLSNEYKNNIKTPVNNYKSNNNNKYGNISKSFYDILYKLWIENNKNAINPMELKYSINEKVHLFKNNNQHDAEEFLLIFLQLLHEEINRENIKEIKNFYEMNKIEGESDISASKRFWNFFKKENNSIIIDLFYGQIKNTLKCLNCAHTETNFEVFSVLNVDIPIIRKIKVLLVPSNNIKKSIQLYLYISENALFIDINVYLKQYIIGFENFKVLLFNYNNTSVKFVKMSENIFNVSKKGMIIIYEISENISSEEDNDENDINEDDNNESNNIDYYYDYFPFITVIKFKYFDEEKDKFVSKNYKSYPRVFPVSSFNKIKNLRIKILGNLRKYYNLNENLKNLIKDDSYDRIINNYMEKNIDIDEIELFNCYQKEYNLLFNEAYQKKINLNEEQLNIIKDYLKDFPFKIYLESYKESEEPKLFFSNDFNEFSQSFKDNQPIDSLIKLMRKGYKLILYVNNNEIIEKMNEIVTLDFKNNIICPKI